MDRSPPPSPGQWSVISGHILEGKVGSENDDLLLDYDDGENLEEYNEELV